ncbi:AAA domain-containing protein [Metamycoplasma hominis]|uniref:AAA domain-containing protein n=1 Tax=Metamycoplasma hominis TaxID=2098 RepID=UPI003CF76CC3
MKFNIFNRENSINWDEFKKLKEWRFYNTSKYDKDNNKTLGMITKAALAKGYGKDIDEINDIDILFKRFLNDFENSSEKQLVLASTFSKKTALDFYLTKIRETNSRIFPNVALIANNTNNIWKSKNAIIWMSLIRDNHNTVWKLNRIDFTDIPYLLKEDVAAGQYNIDKVEFLSSYNLHEYEKNDIKNDIKYWLDRISENEPLSDKKMDPSFNSIRPLNTFLSIILRNTNNSDKNQFNNCLVNLGTKNIDLLFNSESQDLEELKKILKKINEENSLFYIGNEETSKQITFQFEAEKEAPKFDIKITNKIENKKQAWTIVTNNINQKINSLNNEIVDKQNDFNIKKSQISQELESIKNDILRDYKKFLNNESSLNISLKEKFDSIKEIDKKQNIAQKINTDYVEYISEIENNIDSLEKNLKAKFERETNNANKSKKPIKQVNKEIIDTYNELKNLPNVSNYFKNYFDLNKDLRALNSSFLELNKTIRETQSVKTYYEWLLDKIYASKNCLSMFEFKSNNKNEDLNFEYVFNSISYKDIQNFATEIENKQSCKDLGNFPACVSEQELYRAKNENHYLDQVGNEVYDLFARKMYLSFDGDIVKLKRYQNAVENSLNGYVKNPYILPNFFDPFEIDKNEVKKAKETDIFNEVVKCYSLNKVQEENLQKIIASNSLYLLQGPPGTGKTQLITAIMDYYIRNNQNILITSSTHEAINNALERLDKNTLNNPNVLIFKQSKIGDALYKNSYNQKVLYQKFIEKSFNFIRGTESSDPNSKIIELLKQKADDKDLSRCFLNSNLYQIIKLEDEFYKIKDPDSYLGDQLTNIENYSYNSFVDGYFSKSFIVRAKQSNCYIFDLKDSIELANFLYLKFKEGKILVNFATIIKEIESQNSNKNIIFKDQIDAYFEKEFKEQIRIHSKEGLFANISYYEDDLENIFHSHIRNNNLLNVIGVTSTGSSSIDYLEKDITFEYPIGVSIMDEVSKSSTAQILTRINLSEKFILCGDYKQLPPKEEIDHQLIKMKINEIDLKEAIPYTIRKFFKLENDNQRELQTWDNFFGKDLTLKEIDNNIVEFSKNVDSLFQKPIFKSSIEKILSLTNQNKKEYNYGFLNEQYRFNEYIQKVVNNFYTNNEKLIEGIKGQKEPYNFKTINGEIKSTAAFMVDTSHPSKLYLKNLEKVYGTASKENFDARPNLFLNSFYPFTNLKLNLGDHGLINQYNALVDIAVIKSFLKENSPENISNKIGVICLTSNQKLIVKELVKNDPDINKLQIKVDTIDNFQGREKPIIIVDLIRSKNKLIIRNDKKIIDSKRSESDLSFLTEEERLNVAASRAENNLIFVGSISQYLNDETFNKANLLMKYIKTLDSNIYDSSEFMEELNE